MKCLFCEFINGRKTHTQNNEFVKNKPPYKVIPVFENENIFSFLSVPDNKGETHLLIIPKTHYEFIEDLPERYLEKIFSSVAKMSGIIRKEYGDCHILLNNGGSAEQYIKHVHFHIIPKNSKKLPLWSNLSGKKFEGLSNELIGHFQQSH